MSIQQNFPSISPSLSLNFARSKTLDPRITFTRTSSATRVNGQGLIEVIPANSARFDHSYDPVSGTVRSLGLLVEEARTNSVSNNTMQGAVAGTPGTLPTSWGISGLGTLTQQIVGTGIINGINYIDLRFSGTTSTTQISIRLGAVAAIAAANGQTWAYSLWQSVVGGSTANLSPTAPNALLYDSGAGFLTGSTFVGMSFNTTSSFTRQSGVFAISTANTAFIQPQIALLCASGVAIDITLRIGLPQLELGAFPTSVIPTSGSTVTRTADNVSMVGENFSSWYNSSEGTVFTAFRCDNWNSSNQFGKVFTINQAIFGVENNGFWIGNDADNSNTVRYRVRSGGVNQFGPANLTRTSTIVKSAIAVKSSDFAITIDGNIPTTSTSGTLPQVMNSLTIGRDIIGVEDKFLNGHISQLTYYPKRLPNAFLQNLTK